MCVCEYEPYVLFVNEGEVFYGLTECCVGECSEDIEASFSLSVFVICVRGESNFFVICHFKCGGRVTVGYGYVVEC